jgi:hypothetical protein
MTRARFAGTGTEHISYRMIPFPRHDLPRNGPELFTLEARSQFAGTPARLLMSASHGPHLTVLSLDYDGDEQLGGPVSAELFGMPSLPLQLPKGVRPAGTLYRLRFEWHPPRRPVWVPRIPKWRGAWWATHTRPAPEWVSVLLQIEAGRFEL